MDMNTIKIMENCSVVTPQGRACLQDPVDAERVKKVPAFKDNKECLLRRFPVHRKLISAALSVTAAVKATHFRIQTSRQ